MKLFKDTEANWVRIILSSIVYLKTVIYITVAENSCLHDSEISGYAVKFCEQHIVVPVCLAAAKSLQSCPALCNPIGGSPPGSPVPGILQARTLEWVAVSFSNAWKWKVKVKSLSRVRLFATPWTAAYQAPPSVGFSRQEYWSEVPSPSPPSLS